jgi:hypothetical protein
MKHLKYFESEQNLPKINDYVLCDIKWENWISELDIYIKENIGQIIDIRTVYSNISQTIITRTFIIKYKKNLTTLGYHNKYLDVFKSKIVTWSENKADIEDYIETIKQKNEYNL